MKSLLISGAELRSIADMLAGQLKNNLQLT